MIFNIIIIIIFVALGILIFRKPKEKQPVPEVKDAIDIILENRNITKTLEYKLQYLYSKVCFRYIVDLEQSEVILVGAHHYGDTKGFEGVGGLVQDESDIKIIRFSELLGIEGIADDQVTGGIKRAVIGGAIAGDAGAVIGAITAKKEITMYKLLFYTTDIANPTCAMQLVYDKTKTDSYYYKECVSFNKKIEASVRSILANN